MGVCERFQAIMILLPLRQLEASALHEGDDGQDDAADDQLGDPVERAADAIDLGVERRKPHSRAMPSFSAWRRTHDEYFR